MTIFFPSNFIGKVLAADFAENVVIIYHLTSEEGAEPIVQQLEETHTMVLLHRQNQPGNGTLLLN